MDFEKEKKTDWEKFDEEASNKIQEAEELAKTGRDEERAKNLLDEAEGYLVGDVVAPKDIKDHMLEAIKNCKSLLGIEQSDVTEVRNEITETKKLVGETLRQLKIQRDELDEMIERLGEKMENLGEVKNNSEEVEEK